MFETSAARECADASGTTSVFLLPWQAGWRSVFGGRGRRAAIDRWPEAFRQAIDFFGATSAANEAIPVDARPYGPRRPMRFMFAARPAELAEITRALCRHCADAWLRERLAAPRNPTIGGPALSSGRRRAVEKALASALDDDACDAMHAVLDDWGMR